MYRQYQSRPRRFANQVSNAAAAMAAKEAAKAAYNAAKNNLYNAGKNIYNRFRKPKNSSGVQSSNPAPGSITRAVPNKKKSKKAPLPVSVKVNKIAKKVQNLEKNTSMMTSTLVYRRRDQQTPYAAVHAQDYRTANSCTTTNLDTVLSNLLYYDLSTNGYVTKSGITGTEAKSFLIQSFTGKILLRNNYQVPAEVYLYRCVPKDAHSISPTTAYTNGLADNPGGALSATSCLSYPTDSKEFNDLWKVVAKKKVILQAGQELRDSYTTKPFKYDVATQDSQADTYDPHYKSVCWMIFIRGVLGHDTTQSERTTLQAAVDVIQDYTCKVRYQGGQQFTNYIYSDGSSSSFTNGGVVSSMPVADNVGYSNA